MRLLSLLLFVIMVISIVSCGETRVSQCNRLNQVVNKISALPAPKDGQGWIQLASQMEAIGAELRGLKLQDPVLVDGQQKLVALTTEAARSAAELGRAIQTQNNSARNQAIAKIEQLRQKEAPIVNAINQHCSSQARTTYPRIANSRSLSIL
ncbi:MAG: hypothetical protein RMK91_03240 [Pseudanabaenaceae cyanobacterium SKYGB_i_bin29]|nr:hypothetical protein [Pseudanabaenaceae cyanobacterium SKYG29]MDW8420858.1 hypothetical protein [Pseudanabaenaceae cyanobacterium SKYGB_i_bin29]